LPNRGEDVDELEKVIRNQRHSIDVYHT
jgi:hypothetical protein